MASAKTPSTAERRPFTELTRTVLGQRLSIEEVFELLGQEKFAPAADTVDTAAAIWVGSIGYERHKDSSEFARHLRDSGVQRLIDVRELPISRRRGYAKTALGEALAAEGVEYVHMRSLGNPKKYRDLYKSGRVEEGRAGYRSFLVGERREALVELVGLLEEKPSALMCVEHLPDTCHRTVVVEEVSAQLGVELDVAELS